MGDMIFGHNSLNSKFNKILIVILRRKVEPKYHNATVFYCVATANDVFKFETHLYLDHLPAKTSVDTFLAL